MGIDRVLHQIMITLAIKSFKLSPDWFAFCLQKFLKEKALRPGKRVHALLLTTGIDTNLLSLNSKLVGMYASCGDLRSARLVFDKIQNPNVFAFNWMVLTSAFSGYYEEAVGYFWLMQELGNAGNKFTFSIVLKACVGLMDVEKGKEVHAVAKKMGFENDVSVANALIDMYSKCEKVCYARRLFDRMVNRDVASWTSMICGYCGIGKIDQALVLFERMKLEGLEPNDFTWNAMIAGYARSGDTKGAFVLFSRMIREGLVPDLVTWNALISGFVQSQQGGEAFKLFRYMFVLGIKPNHVTVTGLLPACGFTGSTQRGREIHGLIYRMGLDVNIFVATALVDMYSKCGLVKNAQTVFHRIPDRDKNILSWNAMIGCYGKHGMVDLSIHLIEKMQEEGMRPNEVTFVCILSACSHNGLVDEGLKIFRSMKESFGVKIGKEHYACVVDLLCRSGRMEEAYELVKEMPILVPESIIGAFFNGCKIHGRRDLAKMMAEDTLRMDLKKPGGYVTLSNIYAADGDWEEVENVRKLMKKKNILKKPGFSWVEKMNDFFERKNKVMK
ncbi:pentatricopeptide repeat-containing protein At5g59600-like isoform X1 [Juglans microcarpa x Juglans regia]|uniref:pentatricopeptide repeat-containing protein At5g59600-like isoform X1 n=1 Tax=Juglans microcarpa x Juglans regia TaxID=2249226 RepID=UPI001B7D9FA1|nr:pentatricopeptide repeat-containing protein At5g59600-like isoform X1 [Juglans microcarpa x Juglans regia]XP_040992497.1 pentatricopeptide repeat-containing protein At5g59600-like isoform X1 [Juglans microcarpa x Juglans regia]XP_040992498.1 pentatricopeptide repeat-containing protein At5g59600-like isoform X1 [Juglans microcarpa x Juglans regia]